MNPRTESLIETLERLAALLRQYDEDQHASWLESDRVGLQRGDSGALDHLLSPYVGLRSLRDVGLYSVNGHRLPLMEADRITARLRKLVSEAQNLATTISRGG